MYTYLSNASGRLNAFHFQDVLMFSGGIVHGSGQE